LVWEKEWEREMAWALGLRSVKVLASGMGWEKMLVFPWGLLLAQASA
jgi:hypothetical protein